MRHRTYLVGLAVLAIAAVGASAAEAQGRNRGRDRDDRAPVARAVPRPAPPRVVRPQVTRVVPYRYYAPYGYYPRGYRVYPYAYRYPAYGYGGFGYGGYGYGYGYGAPGYFVPVPGRVYGGVRIDLPYRDAEVYADGYFAGTVDDFDGVFQQLSLEPGPHRIEVRAPGFEPISFEVNVLPGQTITYRAPMRRFEP
jgi:hypothetical protein